MSQEQKTYYLKDYRPPAYRVEHCSLTFDLHDDHTDVHSVLSLSRHPDPDAESELVLNAEKMEIVSLAMDGATLQNEQWVHDGEELRIHLDLPDQFKLQVHNRIEPQKNTSLNGLYRSGSMFCSQCEPHGFRCITPYVDRPDVLAKFDVRIEANRKKYPVLLSNGNPVDSGSLADGRHFAEWQDPFPKPSYLFALVAGNLEVVQDGFTTASGRKIELRIYVEEKDLNKVEWSLGSLKRAMQWDEETYGREYDLDLFMIVAVDDFNMGAMENKGLNIFNTSAVLANPAITTDQRFQWIEAVVAHEYFHNWSGNRVTCRDWFQLSLKEGFTVYRDSQFTADMHSAVVKRIEDVRMLRSYQFVEDSGPLAHPVQPASYQEINNFYTLTVYEKGAEVVRMQANLLGEQDFRRATDLYFDRFDGQAVTIEDFADCMAEISGLDLAQFMNWYRQAGTPRLDVSDRYDEDKQRYELTVSQSCAASPGQADKEPFLVPLRIGLIGRDGPLAFTEQDSGPEAEKVLKVSEKKQTFIFEQVAQRPIPSLLRGFSAPVRIEFAYTDEQLAKLARVDVDGFNRWDAIQQLAERTIEQGAWHDSNSTDLLVETCRQVIEDRDLEPALAAVMLQLPTVDSIFDNQQQPDLDSIYLARKRLRQALATNLGEQLQQRYQSLASDEPYQPTPEQIGQRSLKNTLLAMWNQGDSDAAFEAAQQQYKQAGNMTDRYAALSVLVNSGHSRAETVAAEALNRLYRDWKDENLVINQWLSLQASAERPGGLARVQELMQHPAFSMSNPNKVRSLIGAFCGLNPFNFHNPDGAGYQFLADRVLELDRLNPQTASRMVNPLSRWRHFDTERSAKMQQALQAMSEQDLSRDLREIVDKSLA